MNRRMPPFVIFALALLSGVSTMALAQQVSATQIAGGRGGNPFADGALAQGVRIAEVRVRAGDTIDAVQVIYVTPDGRVTAGARHGGSGGRENTLTLDADEYITGISGRYGDTIDSLRIHTNKRTSATFGGRGGDNDFRIDVPPGNQAIGFIGRSGDTVDAIGLAHTIRYLTSLTSRRESRHQVDDFGNAIAGGSGGSPFTDAPLAQGARIAEVRVRAGDTIDGVQVIYSLPDGRLSSGPRHGGRGGREYVFNLDSDEYITGISGRYGDTVDSLRIHTSKRTSPLFGGSGGSQDFRIDVSAGAQAIGFVGRSGDTIDAIGLSSAQRQNHPYTNTSVQGPVLGTTTAGGRGGSPFSDGEPAQGTRVAEVRVRAGDTIDAVQMVYALPDGRVVAGPRHGGRGGREYIFTLDGDEYITGISGRYGDTIDSLRIHTNKRTSPVFGGKGGSRDFRIDVPAGARAIGFMGRSGDTVDAIGLTAMQSQTYPTSSGAQGYTTSVAGGRGGNPFADAEAAQGARVSEVRIRAGDTIDAVQMIYALPDGRVVAGARHGGRGGREYIFTLDSDEYITGISGRYGDTIDSLRIHTNKRTSPVFGGGGGSRDFRTDVPMGTQAIGFVGRAGNTVDAIGLASSTLIQQEYRRNRRPGRP